MPIPYLHTSFCDLQDPDKSLVPKAIKKIVAELVKIFENN